MGPYNLSLCLLQSRLQHMYHGQPYAIFDLNPMSESNLSPSQGLRIWPPDSLLYLYIPELVRMPYIAVNNIPCDVWTLIYVIAFHIYSLIWLPLPQLLDLFRLSFVRFLFCLKGQPHLILPPCFRNSYLVFGCFYIKTEKIRNIIRKYNSPWCTMCLQE